MRYSKATRVVKTPLMSLVPRASGSGGAIAGLHDPSEIAIVIGTFL